MELDIRAIAPIQPSIPAHVMEIYESLINQGFIILATEQRICEQSDPRAKGKIGWMIKVRAKEVWRGPWEVWIFEQDPLADVPAKVVDVEIA